MLSDYQQIVRNLRKLQTINVKEAQKSLQRMSQSGIPFLKQLQTIISSAEFGSKQEYLKLSAASFLNTTIYKQIVDLNEQQCSDILLNILSNQTVSFVIKKALERAITVILDISAQQEIIKWKNMVMLWLNQQLKPSEKNHTCNGQIEMVSDYDKKEDNQAQQNDSILLKYMDKCSIAYFILSCMAVSQLQQLYFHQIIKETFPPCINAILYIKQKPQNISSTYKFIGKFIDLAKQFFQSWKIIFDKLQQKTCPESDSILTFICNRQSLYELFNMVYFFQSSNQIIASFNDYSGDINALKAQAAQLHQRILQFGCANQHRTIAVNKFSNQIGSIIKTVASLAVNKRYIEQYECTDLIVQLLQMFNIYFKRYGQGLEFQVWVNIQQYIIYPLLQADDEQRATFQEDFEQLNAILEDCCDKQKYCTLKSEAAKLLQIMGDKSQLAAERSLLRAVESLKVRLNFVQASENEQYKILEIDSCFLICSIFSYCLGRIKNKDVIKSLKIILCDNRITKMPPFQCARLFFFLGYNYSELFNQNIIEGKHLIEFAMSYSQPQHPTTFIYSLDFLSNIVDQYYDQPAFNFILDKFIKMKSVYENGSIVIFNILARTLDSHYLIFSQSVYISMIGALLARIQKQISQMNQNENYSGQGLIQCLKLIQRVLSKVLCINSSEQKEKRSKVNVAVVKQQIWKISKLAETATKYKVGQEVCRIIYLFLKQQQIINYERNQHYFNVLPCLIDNFQKEQYMGTPYFLVFNQFIMKTKISSNTKIEQNRSFIILNDLFKTLMTGLMHHSLDLAKKSSYAQQKVSIAHLFLLLQNFVAMHGVKICSHDYFAHLSSLCIKYFPESIQDEVTQPCILARALNLLFLCHMHIPNKEALSTLLKYHDLHIFKSYDTKVLLRCLEKQILKQQDLIAVAEMINIMVRVLDQQKKRATQVKQKTTNSKKKSSTKITIRSVNDYQKILEKISTPFDKNIDQVGILKTIIQTMKKNNKAVYDQIINYMTVQVKEKMYSLFQRKIALNSGERVIMKIKGVKLGIPVQTVKNGVKTDSKIPDRKRTIFELDDLEDESESELSQQKKTRKLKNKRKEVNW